MQDTASVERNARPWSNLHFFGRNKRYKKTNLDPITKRVRACQEYESKFGRRCKWRRGGGKNSKGGKEQDSVSGNGSEPLTHGSLSEEEEEENVVQNLPGQITTTVVNAVRMPIDLVSESFRTTATVTRELGVLMGQSTKDLMGFGGGGGGGLEPIPSFRDESSTISEKHDEKEKAKEKSRIVGFIPSSISFVRHKSTRINVDAQEGDDENGQGNAPQDTNHTTSSNATKKIVLLPPLMDFLLRDWTILILYSTGVGFVVYPHRFEIWQEGVVPLRVLSLLMGLAFLGGHVACSMRITSIIGELRQDKGGVAVSDDVQPDDGSLTPPLTLEETKEGGKDGLLDDKIDEHTPPHMTPDTHEKRSTATPATLSSFQKRHTLLMSALSSTKIVVQPSSPPSSKQNEGERASLKERLSLTLPEGFRTQLLENMVPRCEGDIGDFLMKRLCKVETFRKKETSDGKQVVVPLCQHRGMDVFLTDDPYEFMCNNKLLLRCGLRAKPTFVVNIVLPWANLCCYYELPSWFKSARSIVVEKDDPQDVVALKNFLKGSDDYKTQRFQFLPYLREGPMPMRILAPPKRELTGRTILIDKHVQWRQKDSYVDKWGKTVGAVVELSVDVTGDALSRTVASVMRRFLPSIYLDVAFVVDKPEFQDEGEPAACLGFMTMNKMDLAHAAVLPPQSEEEMIRAASVCMSRMSPETKSVYVT